MQYISIANLPVAVTGQLLRIARLRNEHYDAAADPATFIRELASSATRPDLFTFIQPIPDRNPRFPYHLEWDHAAVMNVSTFETWWKCQIKDKTRNMIRKSQKTGIEVRDVAFSDELVRGIMGVHNETPIRQGRRFRHYGKPFATVKAEHGTFLDCSDFVGAYYKGDLVGFMKLVHGEGVSHLMQIISMVRHRDKSPTNALIAKAVERCAERRVPFLHYGSWSRRSMGDFKRHHAFERMAIPRYYVPLTFAGRTGLRLGLHRTLAERMPEAWLDRLASWRGKWNGFRYRDARSFGAVAQLAERRS